MEITVGSGTNARKLELDGYERTGKQEIMTSFDELPKLLDRDDVKVTSVTLNRMAGGDEADIIDEYVKAGVASDYGGKISVVRFEGIGHRQRISTKTNKVLEAKEDSLFVLNKFEDVLFGEPVTEDYLDEESFEEAREEVLGAIENSIKEHQQAVKNLEGKYQEINDLTPEEV